MTISAFGWPFVARIPLALATLGFQVASVAPKQSFVHRLARIQAHYIYRPRAPLESIEQAISAWSPDLLICCDDKAAAELHRIYGRASQVSGDASMRRLAQLIENSLGNPASFPYVQTMSAFILLAQSNGIRCPKTVVVGDKNALENELEGITYPILLKADGSQGGRGVRLVLDERELVSAVSELLLPITWPSPLKRTLAGRPLYWLFSRLSRWPRRLCLQEYLVGRPSNRAVVCWKGKVLAGISVEALETAYEFGPASVVRIIDNDEMKTAAETVVRRLHLSGFVGFDFMLDDADKAWLLEMNARVTPVSHLNVKAGNLPAALFAQLTGMAPKSGSAIIDEQTIALFPQEIARDKFSKHFSSGYHDVPWAEPAFVWACLDSVVRGGFLKTLLKKRFELRDLRLKGRMRAISKSGSTTAASSRSVAPSDP